MKVETDVNRIYCLINKINGKVYVGQTWQTLVNRGDGGSGYKGCVYLYNAIQKHGWGNFYYEELYRCYTQGQADEMENYFADLHDAYNRDKGYNIRPAGARGRISEETKKKISIANTGKVRTEETKQKISETHIGMHNSPDTEFKKGVHYSPDTEFKRGQKQTEKQKEALLKAHLGRKNTEETKKKMSEAATGRTHSEETKQKISENNGVKGKTWKLVDGKRVYSEKK